MKNSNTRSSFVCAPIGVPAHPIITSSLLSTLFCNPYLKSFTHRLRKYLQNKISLASVFRQNKIATDEMHAIFILLFTGWIDIIWNLESLFTKEHDLYFHQYRNFFGFSFLAGLPFFVSATAWYCKLCCEWMGDLHCASAHLKSDLHEDKFKVRPLM